MTRGWCREEGTASDKISRSPGTWTPTVGPFSNRSFFSRKPLDGMMQALLVLCALVSTVSAQASACAVSSFMIRDSGAALYIPGILWQSLRDECNLAI